MSLSTLNMFDFSLKYTNFAGHPPSPPGGVYIPLLVYLSPFEPMDLKYLRPMEKTLYSGTRFRLPIKRAIPIELIYEFFGGENAYL